MHQRCDEISENDLIAALNSDGISFVSEHSPSTDDLMTEVCEQRGICGGELRSEFEKYGKDYARVELARLNAYNGSTS